MRGDRVTIWLTTFKELLGLGLDLGPGMLSNGTMEREDTLPTKFRNSAVSGGGGEDRTTEEDDDDDASDEEGEEEAILAAAESEVMEASVVSSVVDR